MAKYRYIPQINGQTLSLYSFSNPTRMRKITIAFIFFLCFAGTVSAQRPVTTLSGQKILLMPNGKWEYEPTIIEGDTVNVLETGFLTEADTISTDTMKESKMQDGFHSLSHAAKLQEVEAFILVDQLEREVASQKVSLSQARKMKNDEEVKLAKTVIADLEAKLKTANKIYKHKARLAERTKKLNSIKPEALPAEMLALGSELGVDVTSYVSQGSPAAQTPKISAMPEVTGKCRIITDETIDKQRNLVSGPTRLFNFTPDNIKSYFKEKDLMTTDVFFSKTGNNLFLHLKFKMISRDASKNYGFIPTGSMLRIDLLSGRNVILNAVEESNGIVEQYTGNVLYNVRYQVNREQFDLLFGVPVDSAGIMWSSGFERYTIYEVDALMNQLECFK